MTDFDTGLTPKFDGAIRAHKESLERWDLLRQAYQNDQSTLEDRKNAFGAWKEARNEFASSLESLTTSEFQRIFEKIN